MILSQDSSVLEFTLYSQSTSSYIHKNTLKAEKNIKNTGLEVDFWP